MTRPLGGASYGPKACRAPATAIAPDVFSRDGWVPMRQYAEAEAVDFAIVGAGRGGSVLASKLAEAGHSVMPLQCRAVLTPTRGLRQRRARAGEALLARRPAVG